MSDGAVKGARQLSRVTGGLASGDVGERGRGESEGGFLSHRGRIYKRERRRRAIEDAEDDIVDLVPDDRDIRHPRRLLAEAGAQDGIRLPRRAEPQKHPAAAEIVPQIGLIQNQIDQRAGRWRTTTASGLAARAKPSVHR